MTIRGKKIALAAAAAVLALVALALAPTHHVQASTTRGTPSSALTLRALLHAHSPGLGSASGPDVPLTAPGAVKGLDESGQSTGNGDNFTAAQWTTIASDGFKLFITDPINWGSECSDGNCSLPEPQSGTNACTVNAGAVTQIQDAYNAGVKYAIYTRNPYCLKAAWSGLSSTLQTNLAFIVIDVEQQPDVAATDAQYTYITGPTSSGDLHKAAALYSDGGDWVGVMNSNTTSNTLWSSDTLDIGEVPNWGATYPATYPTGFPTLTTLGTNAFGGWASTAYGTIEQQQCCTDVQGSAGTINNSSDQIDLDAVNSSWLAALP